MKYFGVLAFIVTIAGAVWFIGSGLERMNLVPTPPAREEAHSDSKSGINKVLDSARTVANQLGDTMSSEKKITVYDNVRVPESAVVLDLSGRGLSGSLKAEVRMLMELTELNLSNNNFTGLPAEVGQLSKLEVLNLSNNPFTGLPHELANLKNLKTLDLSGTQYSEQDLAVIQAGLSADVVIKK